jgi:hypothetical protein
MGSLFWLDRLSTLSAELGPLVTEGLARLAAHLDGLDSGRGSDAADDAENREDETDEAVEKHEDGTDNEKDSKAFHEIPM